MSKVRTNNRSGNTRPTSAGFWLGGTTFLLGVVFCQLVCGAQAIDPQSTEVENENCRGFTIPTKKDDPAERPVLSLLGGEAGFGNGQSIGSGVAKIVIETPTNQAGMPKRLESESDQALSAKTDFAQIQPVAIESIPTRLPSSFEFIESIPKKNGLFRVAGQQTSFEQEETQHNVLNFGVRRRGTFSPIDVVPDSLCIGPVFNPSIEINPWRLNPCRDEAVFNGGDQGKRVTVDSSWNVYNLNPEDTIGHFDTLDGRRLVTPSNQVAIYAPRFAAVRKLEGLVKSETSVKAGSMDEKTMINVSESQDFSTTTKQHLGLERLQGTKRASGFRDNTRGVTSDNVTQLFGARNTFETYENLSLIRIGRHQNSEGARLGLGMQSANVWQDNVGLQVSVKGAQPVIVNDVYKVQQIVRIDSDDKHAILRVCKVASKISAKAGEQVDFSIRFDNLTGRPIGNVTIIDNLASRLDYIADSAECSLKANFSSERNEVGSLVLRWEIIDPMPANSGGIIRFRCRVQ